MYTSFSSNECTGSAAKCNHFPQCISTRLEDGQLSPKTPKTERKPTQQEDSKIRMRTVLLFRVGRAWREFSAPCASMPPAKYSELVETYIWNEKILTHAKAGEGPKGGVLR